MLPGLFNEFVMTWLPWLAPLAVSSLTGGVVGYGSFRFAQGTLVQRITTLERDAASVLAGCAQFVPRTEFDLLRDDLKEIKADLREVRRTLTR